MPMHMLMITIGFWNYLIYKHNTYITHNIYITYITCIYHLQHVQETMFVIYIVGMSDIQDAPYGCINNRSQIRSTISVTRDVV